MDAWIAISWIGAKGLIDLWQAGPPFPLPRLVVSQATVTLVSLGFTLVYRIKIWMDVFFLIRDFSEKNKQLFGEKFFFGGVKVLGGFGWFYWKPLNERDGDKSYNLCTVFQGLGNWRSI